MVAGGGGNYSVFLGCYIRNRYPHVEKAIKEVFGRLNIKLEPVGEGTCCSHNLNTVKKDVWLNMAGTLISGNGRIMTVCNDCYASLQDAGIELFGSGEVKGKSEVTHILSVLKAYGIENLKKKFKRKLNLNCAVHYGCQILRPSEVRKVDSAERPRILDELVEATGAKSVHYRDKISCCGAAGGLRMINPEVSHAIALRKIENVKESKADCIVLTCPHCLKQFEEVQTEIPVIHLMQLYALAMGVPPESVGIPPAIVEKLQASEAAASAEAVKEPAVKEAAAKEQK